MRKLVYLILLIAAVSCKPLSKDLLTKAKDLKVIADSKKNAINENDHVYKAFIADKPYMFEALKEEKLAENYTQARNVLTSLNSIIERIDKFVYKNSFDDESLLNAELTEVEAKIATIDELIISPIFRAGQFREFYTNYKKYKNLNDTSILALRDSVRSANRFGKITFIKYKQKKASIEEQLLDIDMTLKKATIIRDSFLIQYKLRVSDSIKFNLKKYLDDFTNFEKTQNVILHKIVNFKSKLRELDLSYTKILDDTDADFYITIVRTSWNESSDSDTDQDYAFTKLEVTEEVFEYFDKLDDNAIIADFNTNWDLTLNVAIDNSIWKGLGINVQENMPDGHNYGEIWVQATDVKYYHKYLTEQNGKIDSTDYILVDESSYYKYEDAEGLAIFSKNIGEYSTEADTVPSIPGISHVGNAAYGEWRDSTTNRPTQNYSHTGSFWYFYRPYAYYNTWGGTHYHYNNYNDYTTRYRNRTSYYGGMSSEQHSRRYNTSRGRTETSFRNGRGYRGGGPGGGGK